MNKIIKIKAEVFAGDHELTTQEVIFKLQHQQLVGKEIEGQWYVFSETEPAYQNVKNLSLFLRILNAFFIALTMGVASAVYAASGVTAMEGAGGYAAVTAFLFAVPITFITMIFIKKTKIHQGLAIASTATWLFLLPTVNW